MDVPDRIEDLDQLRELYRQPGVRAGAKARSTIDAVSACFIDLCPFLILATSDGRDSIDASPRGGPPGFVQRLDDRRVAIPDLVGNDRLDSFSNILAHPRVGLLLIVPGKEETLRINGPAALTTDPEILGGFTPTLRTPKLAIVVETHELYGHCAKAFRRAKLWDSGSWGALTDAPDLSAIYSSQFESIEAAEMRKNLADIYTADLQKD